MNGLYQRLLRWMKSFPNMDMRRPKHVRIYRACYDGGEEARA
jgi:hypothetical protein